MGETPIISVVIPVYNAGRFLWACVNSVRNQTFRDWEAILVDDGSTDKSVGICDKIAHDDPRFRVIHKENGGVSSARNAGIDAARGTYLAFLDADDLMVPTYLEKMLRATETYETDLTICSYERFRADWTQKYVFTRFSVVLMKDLKEFLTVYTDSRTNLFGVSIWAKLYRMDIIRDHAIRFDPEITYEEDCDFNVRYIEYVNTVAALGEIMYRYRQSDETLSKAYRKDTFRFLASGFNKRVKLLEKNGMGEFRPNLEAIFMLVIKATSMKILSAPLSHREKLEEYRIMMRFPESQAAARCSIRQSSGFTRKIAFAVRRKSPRLLSLTMQLWKIADSALDRINAVRNKIKYGK